MYVKEIFSAIAIALSFIAFYPYILSIYKAQTKPHVFSWVVWGITTSIVFFAQLADRGGIGAWPTGISALITMYVALLAYTRRADLAITRWDWVFFLLALFSLPAWYVTSNPLWAVLILTSVDILGSVPTFRKAFHKPFEENIFFYFLMSIRSFVSIPALENYSLTTILFPAAIGLMCAALIILLRCRRQAFTAVQQE